MTKPLAHYDVSTSVTRTTRWYVTAPEELSLHVVEAIALLVNDYFDDTPNQSVKDFIEEHADEFGVVLFDYEKELIDNITIKSDDYPEYSNHNATTFKWPYKE